MVAFSDLILPAALGGLAVFLASFVTRMLLKYHWTDFKPLTDEKGLMDQLASQSIRPGQYMFPHCSSVEVMQDPVWNELYSKGPKGYVVISPEGPMAFSKALRESFLFNLAVSFVAAWMLTWSLDGATAGRAWCFVAMVGFLSFGGARIWDPIWKSTPWSVCITEVLDAAFYGAAMGAPFYFLWPAAI